jgi:hypothetical protein
MLIGPAASRVLHTTPAVSPISATHELESVVLMGLLLMDKSIFSAITTDRFRIIAKAP